MINPAQYQRVLGQASDEQLMAMLRRPDKIPSQFIVAEINRRQAMRQSSKAQEAGMAQQMAQQPPSQMQQMQQQQMPPQARGMNDGGITLPMPKPSVGQRNNNPMNLRPVTGEQFFGSMGVSPRNYTRFSSDLAGLRAGFVNMATQAAQGVDTLNKYLGEYAPVGENSASSLANYKNFVADALGVGLDDKIDLSNPSTQLKVADAQIKFENNRDDDYYRSLVPLLPKALQLAQDKDNNPFETEDPASGSGFSIISSAQASTGDSQSSKGSDGAGTYGIKGSPSMGFRVPERIGPEATTDDYQNQVAIANRGIAPAVRDGRDSVGGSGTPATIPDYSAYEGSKEIMRERNARKVLDDSLAGIQSIGRGSNVERDPRDKVMSGGQQGPQKSSRFGFGPSDAMYEKYGDSMDDMGFVENPVKNKMTHRGGVDINNPPGGGRRDGFLGPDFIDRFIKGRLFGGTDERPELLGPEGRRLFDKYFKDDDPKLTSDGRDSVGGSGIKPPETTDAERLERMRKGFGGHGGARLDNTQLTEEVGPALSTATTDLLMGAENSTVGDVALDGAFDITTLKGSIGKLTEAQQKLVNDYNDGAADLLKARKDLMDAMGGQRKTPQNMMFRALIDFGLELASSPETNFLRAVAQAGKKGIASFDRLNQEDQRTLFQKYKMAYDIAAAEFDHKIKGARLAVDMGMQAVSIADTLSNIGYRKQMGDAAIIKANKAGQTTGGGANARALFNAYIKVLDDPMIAIDNGEIPEGYIIRNDKGDAIGVDRQRFLTDAAARFGLTLEDIVTELPPLPSASN